MHRAPGVSAIPSAKRRVVQVFRAFESTRCAQEALTARGRDARETVANFCSLDQLHFALYP